MKRLNLLLLAVLALSACSSIPRLPDGQQMIFVPTDAGLQPQIVSVGVSKSDDLPSDASRSDDERMQNLLTRLVTLTDFCTTEMRRFRPERRLGGFERDYLREYSKSGGLVHPLEIELACLLSADEANATNAIDETDSELIELYSSLAIQEIDSGSALFARLTLISQQTVQARYSDNTYLREMNVEIVGEEWRTDLFVGLDMCGGGRLCRPLSSLCARPLYSVAYAHETLGPSFRKLCDLYSAYRDDRRVRPDTSVPGP